MAIVKMQKVALIAHHSLREEVIAMLHDEGVLEVRPAGERIPVDHSEDAYQEAEVDFAIQTLQECAGRPTLEALKRKPTLLEVSHALQHTDVRGIVDALHQLEKADTEANRRLQELDEQHALFGPWKDFPYRMDALSQTESTVSVLGTIPVQNEAAFRDALTQLKRTIVEKHGEDAGKGYFSVIVWKEDIRRFEEIATGLGWTAAVLNGSTMTPAQTMEEIMIAKREQRHILEHSADERRRLSVELPNLVHVRLFLYWLDEKREVRESLALTDATITLLGWMPANRFDILESRLLKLSDATALLRIKADEGEDTPVLLKNTKFFTPFESVTNLYGLPLPSEMDPTTALSPFFILYFALCLTDAGYGIIIALIFGITLLVTRKSMEEAKLLWLLFFGGIATVLVSIPFGGWFGLTPEQVPSWLTRQTPEGLMFKGQLWHLGRQSGITFLQNLSLALGLTHIFFGIFLAGWHKWIHGNRARAFWQDFTAHLLLGAAILYALRPTPYPLYILLAAIALTIWGKGYGTRWFLRPIMGFLGFINFCISLLSNSLSYLRLLALGLVTGAIAAAVNQVAVELGKLFPLWIGIPVIIAIFLMGHLVSIALNTLGSFIHSGRLQFIEFFSQFFEGGGKAFTPFKRSIR